MRKYLMIIVVLSGCYIENGEICSSDQDYKGDRVCEQGRCTEPTTPTPDGDGDEFVSGGQVTRSYAATGALVAYGQKAFCTATLVSPTKVLTAAHCVASQSVGSIEFVIGSDLNSSQTRSQVSAIKIHESWNGNVQAGNDLAILTLITPVSTLAPVNVHVGSIAGVAGQQMTLVGYGRQFNDQITGIRRLARVTIQSVSNQTVDYSYMGMGACHGDSGGPAFLEIGGVPHQIGVTSWGDPSCLADGHYQRLDVHAAWLAANGVPAERPLQCGANGCDGQCEEDQGCWDLMCPSGSCSSPKGHCIRDGSCDADCGLTDPDCGHSVDYCQMYGLYGNGFCDLNCPSPDPDCSNMCTPAYWVYDQFQNLCFFLDAQNRVCTYFAPYCDVYGCRCF